MTVSRQGGALAGRQGGALAGSLAVAFCIERLMLAGRSRRGSAPVRKNLCDSASANTNRGGSDPAGNFVAAACRVSSSRATQTARSYRAL